MFKKSDKIKKGYIDELISPETDIINEIKKMRKEKNAIILAHYYQTSDIQDIADYVGDSLDLSRRSANSNADIILFAGVKFMAETAKILSPESKVLLPDLNADCSLSQTCPPGKFKKFIRDNPGRTVITYINSSAEVKALSDIICTSSNAQKIVESLPEDEKLIFAPDRNLGNYVNGIVKRDMIIWQGACHVHEKFSADAIRKLKNNEPDASIIVHPECEMAVRKLADYIGSTGNMLKYIKNDSSKKYIVGTEPGIIYQMKKASPDKVFIPAPADETQGSCSECEFMKMITLEKIFLSLKYEEPELIMDKELIIKAEKPIRRMLDISERLGI